MNDQMLSAVIAILLGVGVGVLAFVPFVAVSYRRRGRLSFGRFVLWAGALVYFWAIWTYTLLPLPDPDAIRCVGMVTDPWELVREVQKALARSGNPITDPAILQIAFNVLLFLPLGFFLRVLGGRGIVVATLVGFVTSLAVETTQLTGVWGIYPCAYRFFDVGDLITNTTGALLGSIVALVVPRQSRGFGQAPNADEPRPVTKGRRALAMLCDGLGFALIASMLSVGTQLFLAYVVHDEAAVRAGTISNLVAVGGTAALWLLIVLISGRTVGDLAVQLRYSGGRVPTGIARLLRWLGGYAGLQAFSLLPTVGGFSGVLILVSIVLLFTTRRGRGLPGLISGQELVDARRAAVTVGRLPGSGTVGAGAPVERRRSE